MIPKYIFDTSQQTINMINVSIKDKLLIYRMYLYYCLRIDLKKEYTNKFLIINEYKIKTSEIDYELKKLK